MELSLAAAIFAGIVSFLSPCVLPIVPAYLGQMGIVAAGAVGLPSGAQSIGLLGTSRWHVLPHAIAFVVGFGAVFTVLGLTFYAFRPVFDLPPVRIVGGLVVIVLGLNLLGVLRIGLLNRSWRPAYRFGVSPIGGAAARNPFAALALGSVFALGHTPCIGPTLGAILGLSLSAGAAPQVVVLLVGYSLGIGLPFIALAVALDRTRRLTALFRRHGRAIELIGGGLVVLIGFAIVFDLINVFSQAFQSLWPRV